MAINDRSGSRIRADKRRVKVEQIYLAALARVADRNYQMMYGVERVLATDKARTIDNKASAEEPKLLEPVEVNNPKISGFSRLA
jgi:hypothetical protein